MNSLNSHQKNSTIVELLQNTNQQPHALVTETQLGKPPWKAAGWKEKLCAKYINKYKGCKADAQASGSTALSISHYIFMNKYYSFTAPTLTPLTKYFCRNGYAIMNGRIATMIAAFFKVSVFAPATASAPELP